MLFERKRKADPREAAQLRSSRYNSSITAARVTIPAQCDSHHPELQSSYAERTRHSYVSSLLAFARKPWSLCRRMRLAVCAQSGRRARKVSACACVSTPEPTPDHAKHIGAKAEASVTFIVGHGSVSRFLQHSVLCTYERRAAQLVPDGSTIAGRRIEVEVQSRT